MRILVRVFIGLPLFYRALSSRVMFRAVNMTDIAQVMIEATFKAWAVQLGALPAPACESPFSKAASVYQLAVAEPKVRLLSKALSRLIIPKHWQCPWLRPHKESSRWCAKTRLPLHNVCEVVPIGCHWSDAGNSRGVLTFYLCQLFWKKYFPVSIPKLFIVKDENGYSVVFFSADYNLTFLCIFR